MNADEAENNSRLLKEMGARRPAKVAGAVVLFPIVACFDLTGSTRKEQVKVENIVATLKLRQTGEQLTGNSSIIPMFKRIWMEGPAIAYLKIQHGFQQFVNGQQELQRQW